MDTIEQMEQLVIDLSERQAITDLMHRYCHLTDLQDIEGLVTQVFAADGSDDHGGGPVVGSEALARWFEKTFANVAASAHNLSNIIIDREGDRASVRSSIVTWSWTRASSTAGALRPADYMLCSYYVDEVVKLPQGWRILRRFLETNGESIIGVGTLPSTQTGMHALARQIATRSVRNSPFPTEVSGGPSSWVEPD